MPFETNEFDPLIQNALRSQEGVWTSNCPEPETLQDWLKRGDSYPRASWLLDHIIGCAYCRRERATLQEIRARNQEAALVAAGVGDALLPDKVTVWMRELITEGITAPIKSLQGALGRMSAMPRPALATMRDSKTPTILHPTQTAIRTTQPRLRWTEAQSMPHEVVIVRQETPKRRRPIWRGVATIPGELTVPEEAGLESGGIYLWQAVAHAGSEEYPSVPAGFVILPERIRLQLERLETEVENITLAQISLCEAYGLYEEARQRIETFVERNPDDTTLQTIRAKLREPLPFLSTAQVTGGTESS